MVFLRYTGAKLPNGPSVTLPVNFRGNLTDKVDVYIERIFKNTDQQKEAGYGSPYHWCLRIYLNIRTPNLAYSPE